MTARSGLTFYWWATLVLGGLLMGALAVKSRPLALGSLAADAFCYWRLRVHGQRSARRLVYAGCATWINGKPAAFSKADV